MNEPTPPPPTTTRPNFFVSDHFTLFISADWALWIYGNSEMNISKHTPRVKLTEITPHERVPLFFRKALLPVNGITGEKGHFSVYITGLAVNFPLYSFSSSTINDPYVKQKIEEHYTYNYPPTTATTP
jgi:hypothetical protein